MEKEEAGSVRWCWAVREVLTVLTVINDDWMKTRRARDLAVANDTATESRSSAYDGVIQCGCPQVHRPYQRLRKKCETLVYRMPIAHVAYAIGTAPGTLSRNQWRSIGHTRDSQRIDLQAYGKG
jgi:hypothetical protein